jgi:signal transduction histidine kinase
VNKDAAADDVRRLQRCISDLMVVLALPAMWTSHEPSRIVNTLLDVMVRILDLESAYFRFSGSLDESQTEWVRAPSGADGQSLEPATFRVGLAGDVGMLVLASSRSDFPTTIDKLLIQVAANEAAIALQEARYARQQQQAAEELERRVKRAMELNHHLAGRLIANEEAERQRIALELHDDLGQKIAMLKFEIDQIAGSEAADGLAPKLQDISQRAAAIAQDVRNASHQLYPPTLQLLGLQTALQALCRDISQRGVVSVAFASDGELSQVDSNVSLCVYRIVQTALQNVGQHSQARDAYVYLSRAEQNLELQIVDSGVGFDVQAQHEGLGLVSMRERVALVNGQLTVESAVGTGTRITVRVPLS